jgi:hypothetical protein
MSNIEYETPIDTYQLENSSAWMIRVHDISLCDERPCTIHKRTDHAMRSFEQKWNGYIMVRVCPHDFSHPDPDEYKLNLDPVYSKHSCDGCCGKLVENK